MNGGLVFIFDSGGKAMYIVTCDEMREAEKRAMSFGIPSSRLMENAGSAAARFIRRKTEVEGKKCVVVCGKGNNGGDGYVVARKLLESGAEVTVIMTAGKPKSEDALDMFDRCNDMAVKLLTPNDEDECRKSILSADIIADALYGTGFHGEIEDEATIEIIELINKANAVVFAVDMPSGCSADLGSASTHCVNADYTITFAFPKIGQFLFPAADYCGKVTAVNIGIPESICDFKETQPELLTKEIIESFLPIRKKNSNKGTFGKVLCLCGSLGMAGAAYMSACGAIRSGAGLAELLVPRDIYLPIASKLDECMVRPLDSTENGAFAYKNLEKITQMSKNASAVLIGCGISRDEETARLVRNLIFKIDCPIILDADGLNAFEGHINLLRTSQKELILTPHPGEMSRLCQKSIPEIQSSRLETACSFAKENGVTLVLKGANTIIADKNGKAYINPTGNPGMAKGGSGDILAGMTAAFAAQKLTPEKAACAAAFIHGAAGDRAAEKFSQYGMIPTDILMEVPQIFLDMSR